jgi:D-alanyl-D-alanine carboxypeptidase
MSNTFWIRTILACFLAALTTATILSCSENHNGTVTTSMRLQEAVDTIRKDLETRLGKTVPSINVLIDGPSGTYFTGSASEGNGGITQDTYFRFASNTKNFTATAILKMHEDGWLDYRAKITDIIPGSTLSYVPDTPEWNIPNKGIITIEQLLQHSAGVYDVSNGEVPGCGGLTYVEYIMIRDPAHQFTAAELVKQVTDHNLSYKFPPGTGHKYSNTGYTVLGEIISRVYTYRSGSAKTCIDYLRDHIYGPDSPVPISIHFPYLATDVTLPNPFCCSHIFNSGPGESALNCENNMSAHVAEGNGYGTMRMLNRYIRTLMKGQNVLSSSSIEVMKNDISPGDETYALGCLRVSNLGYGHNGAIEGYLSLMLYDPETDVSVIVMIPYWDISNGVTSFVECFKTLNEAGWAARQVLGYPGKPT